MTVWIIPLIPFAPARARIRQFDLTIDNGRLYLQSGSRILTFIIAAAAFSMYARPGWTFWDPQFLVYIATVILLMSVGIGEIFYIFPINDRVLELGEILDRNSKTGKDDAVEKELAPLLKKWQLRNFWTRAVPVMISSVSIALAGPP